MYLNRFVKATTIVLNLI